jgi:hypothetical protein
MDERLVTFLKRAQCCCDECCLAKSPETVEVKDAGNPIANGIFVRCSTDTVNKDHVVNYERKGGVTMSGEPATFYITLTNMSSSGSFWSIWWRTVRDAACALETYHYLYQTSARVNWEYIPPRDGWYISPNRNGTDPPPTLTYDPNFHLERFISRVRPDETSPDDMDIVCLSESLDEREFSDSIREAAAYWSYACEMQLECYQETICAALFKFIFADYSEEQAARDTIVQLLDVSSRREQCIVLELAVWKCLCTMQCPDNLAGILDVLEWCRRGWKIRKQEARQCSNEFHVIISSVLPFLDSLVIPVKCGEPAAP